ncbi:MAG: DUF6531 domain-containing protein, partial [Firmicutes bacterium]|nr:DUF6531 domain-containing protein [Bacillota bacterium]
MNDNNKAGRCSYILLLIVLSILPAAVLAGDTSGKWSGAHGGCPDDGCGKGGSGADNGVGNPIHMGTGNKFQEVPVWESGGAFPLAFKWFYNSRLRPDTNTTFFRGGWTHSYSERITESQVSGALHVFVHQDSGRIVDFKEQPPNSGAFVGDEKNESAALYGKLRREGSGVNAHYVFTSPDDIDYIFDPSGKLSAVENRSNGFRHELAYVYTPNTTILERIDVTHGNGQTINLNFQAGGTELASVTVAGGETYT